ncbi:conserved hypothetical protein [Escherichia phage AR1]|uniref:Uncharacterized protein n=1 Tax=Escherichia phage AR1 TaxID=66711 RepID=D4Z9Q2_BPAR1|nr:hypothetical protein AR1_107 [Escherichia phage AR1]BAI83114.1 conserved hypothetical protein [Escherichia phage AR1]
MPLFAMPDENQAKSLSSSSALRIKATNSLILSACSILIIIPPHMKERILHTPCELQLHHTYYNVS